MKITKYVHSCLLVETSDRVALFDPGAMSVEALDVDILDRLDDIFITHIHADHMSLNLIQPLVEKFPNVRITSNPEVVAVLAKSGIVASSQPPPGVAFFEAPHERIFSEAPQNVGIHYLNQLTNPGDSHSFDETKTILALPVSAPWGSAVSAFNLAVALKPQHVLPIHDWHWHDQARAQMYNMFVSGLRKQGITFHKLETAQPVELAV